MQMKKADAVFEGGGVKGIALVGAVCYAESLGYRWHNIAGTSAGAIVGALLAAGYKGHEIHRIMQNLDYRSFCDAGLFGRVPRLGPFLNLTVNLGLYKGQEIEDWLNQLLQAKGVSSFGDLRLPNETNPRYRYKLQVIASDLSLGRMLVLPEDIQVYGGSPDRLSVARAVRMSLGIPFFYEPVRIKQNSATNYVVDGGILSNFPVWLFDSPNGEPPPWPTFGFRLVDPNEDQPHNITGPVSMLSALVNTMMSARDARDLEEAHWVRTISINTLGIKTTDFNISTQQAEMLFNSGREAARQFFRNWDFHLYKSRYRLNLKSSTAT